LLALPLLASAADITRDWTDKQGRSFEALLLSYDDEFVRVERTSDKRQFKLPRNSLSEVDNAYLDGLQRAELIEKILKDVPKTYDDAHELSVDEDMPVFIFYRNGASSGEFDGLVEKFAIAPEFQEYLKDKALLSVISQNDVNFEAIAQSYISNSDRPCMIIIKGYRTHSLRALSDTDIDAFMENVKAMYKQYDEDPNL